MNKIIFTELSNSNDELNDELNKNIDSFEKKLDNENKEENIQNLSINYKQKKKGETKNNTIEKSENLYNLNKEKNDNTFNNNKIQKEFVNINENDLSNNFTSKINLNDKFKNDYNINEENLLNNNKRFRKGFNQRNDFNYPKRSYIKNYKKNLNKNLNYMSQNFSEKFPIENSEKLINKSNNKNDNLQLEINKRITNFILENKKVIFHIKKAYPELTEYECGNILDLIQNKTSQTIFETMNDISAENIIKLSIHFHQKKMKIKPFIDNLELNIFELINLKYLNPIHKQILLYYKIFDITKKKELNLNLPDYYFYQNENERRRVLKKNEDGLYNYLPIKCLKSHENQSYEIKEKCNFAHSDNEIYFHSLIYKTKKCKKKNFCNFENFPELCFKSHNFNNDFRLIYNYLDDKIKEFMFIYEKNMGKIKSYEECFNDLEIEKFNLDTFKILECKNKNIFNDNCKIDRHLCLFYHNNYEKRRPQNLFKYTNEYCKYLICENGNCSFKKCPFGNYCHYCHSTYEFYYHEKNFGKLFPCLREKNINKECIYKETCYGIHNNFYNEYKEKEKKNQIKNQLIEIKKKYEIIKNCILKFSCLVCSKIPKNNIYYLIQKYHNKDELHFMCKECKEKCGKICPLCNEKINENDFIEVNLININNNINDD